MQNDFSAHFFSFAGLSLLLIDLLTRFAFIHSAPIPSEIFIFLIFVLIIGAFIYTWPRSLISKRSQSPDTTITVKIGNLFDEPGHLVIGMSDTFDTDIGDVIKGSSIQGQFLVNRYQSNRSQLDTELNHALALLKIDPIEDNSKKRGKVTRFPVGTTVRLGSGSQMYFCTAYSKMGNDLKTNSTTEDIWNSLNHLWQCIRLNGQGTIVSMPVIGSDLSRTGLAHTTLIQLITLSFI